MSQKSPCYQLGRSVVGNVIPLDNLRLETSPDVFCGLPYHHVEFTKFASTQDLDTITLLCLNRTIRITGKNLRNLGIALLARSVESISPLPERYASLPFGEDGCVKSIEILEQKEAAHA
jgi:hypothetical protein